MKFFDLLRKLGIYRSGAVSYKGNASDRKIEFIQEGVYNSDKDNSTKEDLSKGGKLVSILNWVFGVSFLIISLSIIFSDIFLGLTFAFLGLYITPITKKYLHNKFSYRPTKKQFVLVFVCGLILSMVFVDSSKTYEIKTTIGEEKKQVLSDYNNALVKLILSYKQAQIDTAAATTVEFESINKEEYLQFLKQIIAEWKQVEKDADALSNIIAYAPEVKTVSFEETWQFIKKAFAQGTGPSDININYDGGNGEVSLEKRMTNWDAVEYVKYALPDKSRIKATQIVFKDTAKNAQTLIENHQQKVTENWNNKAELYKIGSNTARVMGATSKVTLLVGGAVITGGIGSLGFIPAATLAVGGADAALTVTETGIIVALGHKEAPPMVKYLQDKLYWPSTILAIKDLKLNTSLDDAAGNISTVGGLVLDGVNAVLEIDGDSLKVTTKKTISGITKDTVLENVYPDDLVYNTKPYEVLAKEQKELNTSTDMDYKAAVQKLEDEKQRLLKEQERKDTAIQKIIEQKEIERATKPVSQTPVVEDAPTPIKSPVLPAAETYKAGDVVGSCKVCFDSKLDCACGRETCQCCAPGADCWPD